MKLLHCRTCGDVRRIYGVGRFPGQNSRCQCQKVVARYVSRETVMWNGVGAILGLEVDELAVALANIDEDQELETPVEVTGCKVLPRKWRFLSINPQLK